VALDLQIFGNICEFGYGPGLEFFYVHLCHGL
jgi:hypothetical protein